MPRQVAGYSERLLAVTRAAVNCHQAESAPSIDQTGQESRSASHGAATSLIAMDITIHASFLPHDDPDASLAFYRDTLGF